jgi:hypothetical protein
MKDLEQTLDDVLAAEQDAKNDLDEIDDPEYPTAPTIRIPTIWLDSSRDAKEFGLCTPATGALLEDLQDSTMETRELAKRLIAHVRAHGNDGECTALPG